MVKDIKLLVLERINEKTFMYESEFSFDELGTLCHLESEGLIICEDLVYSLTDEGFFHMSEEQRKFLSDMQREYENKIDVLSERNRKLAKELYELKKVQNQPEQKSLVHVYSVIGAKNLMHSLKYPVYLTTNSSEQVNPKFSVEAGRTVHNSTEFIEYLEYFLFEKNINYVCVEEV